MIDIRHGDCIATMRAMDDACVDAIVTDPPYELGFMGKTWDSTGIANSVEMWTEACRVLKPGGHMLAFSSTRTYHRMVCAIEDAGFEIRDQIGWLYGSGFPKSLDVSKAIDKAAGAEREVIGRSARAAKTANKVGTAAFGDYTNDTGELTAPASPEAQQWTGWGTALKPCWEPVVVARKPLAEKTVAANVLKYGTGAISIDRCRVHPDTKGRLLSRVKHIASCAAVEFGDSTSGTVRAPSEGEFRRTLGNKLSASGANPRVDDHGAGSVRSGQSLQDCQGDYPVYRHFCDALVRLEQVSAQSGVLQQECAHTHSHQPRISGGPACGQLDTLLSECRNRLSNWGSAHTSGRGLRTATEYLRHAVARYLVSCLESIGIPEKELSNALRADTAARWLVQDYQQIVEETDRLAWGSPLDLLWFNINAGPYIITNTVDVIVHYIEPQGRFPGNLIHDGSDEVLAAFWAFGEREARGGGAKLRSGKHGGIYGEFVGGQDKTVRNDTGSAARFFYSSKANKTDRAGSSHPTVKPVSLMRYLCKLVTPPGGTVLDMFAGSGTTLQAAMEEGFSAIGIEQSEEYVTDIRNRIGAAREGLGLFAVAAE